MPSPFVRQHLLSTRVPARWGLATVIGTGGLVASSALNYADDPGGGRLAFLIFFAVLWPWSVLQFLFQIRRGWNNPERPKWDGDRRLRPT